MSDYIEREAVLAYPIRKDHYDRKHGNEHFIFGIESVIEFVENLPAADVAPVRHGRWYFAEDSVFRCSECDRICFELNAPYCYCGGRMDGKEGEGA